MMRDAKPLFVEVCWTGTSYYLIASFFAEPNSKTVDHMIQVEPMENLSPEYILHNERHMVHFPLPPPPPGDESSQILAKLTCLTSDPGGPNRRPFSMVFALVKE